MKTNPKRPKDKDSKDSPSHDVHHDENRKNAFDPEVARRIGMKPSSR